MSAPECYNAAVEYMQRGWSVIPINPLTKKPLVRWAEFQTRLPTLDELQTWWRSYPHAGVAVITGQISRLVVVDFDGPEALATIDTWPETHRVDTPKGAHLYYAIGNERPPTGVANHGPGIDSRGEGGYVVAPPTIRNDQGVYRYRHESGQPRWRPDRCMVGGTTTPVFEAPGDHAPDWDSNPQEIDRHGQWIDDALRNGVSTPGRNDTCSRLAGYFAGKGVEEGTAQILLLEWAKKCRPPLEPEETVTTVASVYRTAERRAHAEQATANEPVEPATKDSQGTAPLQLMRFREFRLAFESQKTEWLLETWVPAATIMILVSPPGGFKSWFTAELAASVVTGTEFMGTGLVPAQGPVVLMQQEDPHKMTARRLTLALRTKLKLAQDAEFPDLDLYAQVDRDFHFGNKTAVRRLEEWIAKVRPKLVVLDPLYSMVDGKDHMVGAAVQMKILKGIRDRYGCSFVIVHHTSKAKFLTLDRERGHGSQFLNAFVEGGFQTAKFEEKNVVVKRHFKAEEDEYARIHWGINTKIDPPVYEPKAANINIEELEEIIDAYNQKARGGPAKQPFGDD
jgi:hypothetical protein